MTTRAGVIIALIGVTKNDPLRSVDHRRFRRLTRIAIGLFLAWAIIQALGEEGFDSFVLPFGTLALWIVVANNSISN